MWLGEDKSSSWGEIENCSFVVVTWFWRGGEKEEGAEFLILVCLLVA
jgi:hypothetical protein